MRVPARGRQVTWWGGRHGVGPADWDSRPSVEAVGTALAVGVTALAFVAKHVVDVAAPPFGVTALLERAFVLCGLRAR